MAGLCHTALTYVMLEIRGFLCLIIKYSGINEALVQNCLGFISVKWQIIKQLWNSRQE